MKKRYTTMGLALSIAIPQAALAVQPDAGQILNEQQQARPRPLERLPQQEKPVEPLMAPEAGAVKVSLKEIRFSGAEGVAAEAELQAQVADAVGMELSYAGLQQLAERVTRYVKAKGFPLAKAYLPAQEIAGGVLEIAIQVGRVEGNRNGDGIDIQADGGRLDKEIIRGTIAGTVFQDGEHAAVKTENLERGLLLLNDMPGIAARASLEKGSQPGTSKLVILADEGPLFTGNVSGDNFGSRYTGKWRTNFEANLNDPLGKGEQLTANFTHTDDLNLAAVGYRMSLGQDGWFVGGNFSNLDYQIGQELASLDAQGTVRAAGINLGYPFVRSQKFSLWGSLGYNFKWLQDKAMDSVLHDKQINAATASMNGTYRDRWWQGATTNFGVSLSGGDLDLSGSKDDLAADRNGAKSHGAYTKSNYNISRLQRLGDRLGLFWAIYGQLAGDNLNSSEKFILGGPSGVRAYPMGEGIGDTGWLTNVEIRYDLPTPFQFDNLQLVGFFDSGRITVHETSWNYSVTNAGNANRYGLSGAGVGLNMSYAQHLTVRTSVATAVGSNPGRDNYNLNGDGRRDNTQFWLQAMLSF